MDTFVTLVTISIRTIVWLALLGFFVITLASLTACTTEKVRHERLRTVIIKQADGKIETLKIPVSSTDHSYNGFGSGGSLRSHDPHVGTPNTIVVGFGKGESANKSPQPERRSEKTTETQKVPADSWNPNGGPAYLDSSQ
jgi:hypothetical protein